jgi:hypothetical protein
MSAFACGMRLHGSSKLQNRWFLELRIQCPCFSAVHLLERTRKLFCQSGIQLETQQSGSVKCHLSYFDTYQRHMSSVSASLESQ